MPIKWNALQVSEGLDRIDELLTEADSYLSQASRIAGETAGIPRLPQYLSYKISKLRRQLTDTRLSFHADVKSIRENIPEDALQRQKLLAKQPKLDLGI